MFYYIRKRLLILLRMNVQLPLDGDLHSIKMQKLAF